MNTNDLPPAARLAALIEAGRAAHPEIQQGHGVPFEQDDDQPGGPRRACAIGFAALALGHPFDPRLATYRAARLVGIKYDWFGGPSLGGQLVRMNDGGASIEDVCHSLREGELSRVPVTVPAP